jgi:tetratricopeptide (TPR) repeat protein
MEAGMAQYVKPLGKKAWTAALCAATALAAAGGAKAAVTVIGGGLAEACSKAALSGLADQKFEAICTQSLESEFMGPRDRAGTYVNRGVLKLRRGAYEAAAKDFDVAVNIKPDLGEIYVNRGAAEIGMRRYSQGLSDINKALALGVEEPEKAYYNRALAEEGLDDLKAAYFDYQKALELKPDWAPPKVQLSRFTVHNRDGS